MTADVSSKKDGKLFFIADVGTTTIKASLGDCTLTEKNPQSVFGLDVISRVLYAHYNGVAPLQRKVLETLFRMFCSLCDAAGVKMDEVSGLIITGNTVMLHLVRGLSVQGFEMAPFKPVSVDAAEIPFSSLFESIAACSCTEDKSSGARLSALEIPVYFPPCIDAFLGADAVCAALHALEKNNVSAQSALNLSGKRRFPLLIADVGTNTEIMLLSDGSACSENAFSGAEKGNLEVTCCSTAAGPAFEGGVLGGRYTGSELVHMLAELLESGAMDETGLLQELSSPVVTQEAVRQLQLAKGAVCAAIETLLLEAGCSVSDVGTFVVCGNFGSALSAEEAERIGLFPAGLSAVTEYVGNAAELGARLLVSEEKREKAKKIAASGKLIQLADNRFFARRYIERMNFTL